MARRVASFCSEEISDEATSIKIIKVVAYLYPNESLASKASSA